MTEVECQKFAEMEINQHFGKTLATHFQFIILHGKHDTISHIS